MMHMQGKDEGPGAAPVQQAAQTAQTAWAMVIEPGGAANRYRWDPARGALVLDRVERPDAARATWATGDEPRGADLARLPLLSGPSSPTASRLDDATPTTLAASAPGLLALALSTPANPAGIWLELRILGAFRLVAPRIGQSNTQGVGQGVEQPSDPDLWLTERITDYVALGVPAADPTAASVTSLATLTPALRERARRALLAIAPADAAPRIHQGLSEPLTSMNGLTQGLAERLAEAGWLDAAAIMERYRAARVVVSQQAAEGRRQAEAERAERLTTRADAAGDALLRRLGREAAAVMPDPPGAHTTAQDGQEVAAEVAGGWRGLAGISPAELRARGMAVYGEPEDLLRWLPARFARYLGELLFPDERALFFAAASALTLSGWTGSAPIEISGAISPTKREKGEKGEAPARQRGGWLPERLSGRLFGAGRTRRLNDGLLLVTDRQALLLRDYAPANGAGTQLGFLARSWPLGRLVAASVAPAGVSLAAAIQEWPERVRARLCAPLPFDDATAPPAQTARLLLALEGRAGIQLTGMAFPPEAAQSAQRAADLLRGFIPLLGDAGRGDWRLRRMPRVTTWRPTASEERELESLGGMVASTASTALLAATSAALAPGELVLAQGRTPQFNASNASGPDVPALLTLTPQRLLLASLPPSLPPGASARLDALPVADLTSVTLSYSLMGSWLAVARPHHLARPGHLAGASVPTACEELRVAFPSPLLTPFRALTNRVRALLESGPQA